MCPDLLGLPSELGSGMSVALDPGQQRATLTASEGVELHSQGRTEVVRNGHEGTLPSLASLTARTPYSAHVPVADEFPDDLTGHFWAALSRVEDIDRWRFTVYDYQNNVVLSGVARTERQAARIVRAWDAVVASGLEEGDDPSLPFSEGDG